MKLVLNIIIIFILFSCKNENNINSENVEVIDLSNSFDDKKKVNLSEVVEKVEYIQLQTDSSCLISRIRNPSKDIQFFNNEILINDRTNSLLQFSNSGEFLKKIGEIGKGPGEYLRVDAFTFFQEEGFIIVFSAAQRKAMVYDKNGNFQRDIKIDFWPMDVMSIGNNLIFINTLGRRNLTDYYNLSVISSDGKLKKRLLFKPKEKILEDKMEFRLQGFRGSGYLLNNIFHYFEKNSYEMDTIWKITNSFNIIPKYIVDLKEPKMPLEGYSKSKNANLKLLTKYSSIESINETSRFIFTEIFLAKEKRLYRIYHDKYTKKNNNLQFKKEYGKGIDLSFYNDIDGGLAFWPVGKVNDNKMFMLTYGYEIKEYLQRRGDNHDFTDPEARKKLLKLVERSKISDNPILMIVTFKK